MLTLQRVNADLATSVAALTSVLAADPVQLDRYLVERAESGRGNWREHPDMTGASFTRVLIAEINVLTGFALHCLRSGLIVDPSARLSAYEAIDLAARRAADAPRWLAPEVAPPATLPLLDASGTG